MCIKHERIVKIILFRIKINQFGDIRNKNKQKMRGFNSGVTGKERYEVYLNSDIDEDYNDIEMKDNNEKSDSD